MTENPVIPRDSGRDQELLIPSNSSAKIFDRHRTWGGESFLEENVGSTLATDSLGNMYITGIVGNYNRDFQVMI